MFGEVKFVYKFKKSVSICISEFKMLNSYYATAKGSPRPIVVNEDCMIP